MLFYREKFIFFRKKERFSVKEFAFFIGVARTTLWKWEKGIAIPSEAQVRHIAQLLKVSVKNISDLDEFTVPRNSISGDLISSWVSMVSADEKKRIEDEEKFINKIRVQQHELRQVTVLIKALLSSMHTMFYFKDISLNYIAANAAFLEILGLNSNYQVLGKSDEDILSKSDAKTNSEEDYHVIITGEAVIEKEGFIVGSRKKKWGMISKEPVKDSSGKIVGLVCTIVDITKKKKAEEIRNLLEYALNNSSDVVWLREPPPSNKLIYVSDSIFALCGYRQEKFFNNTNFWYEVCVHPDDKTKHGGYGEERINGMRVYRIVLPTGEIKWIESRVFYKNFNEQKCIGSIDRDVTNILATR